MFRSTKLIAALTLLFFAFTASAQDAHRPHGNFCHYAANHTGKTTVASVAEDLYDVKYVKFNLAMNNTSTDISGDVSTNVVFVGSSTTYVFEIDTLLTIDSLKINGTIRPYSRSGQLCTVTLAAAASSGTPMSARVWYHGTPVSGPLYATEGLNNFTDPTYGGRVTFTQSEPMRAHKWWPCKQSLTDKIDSVDMWVTVPDTLKAGSNGLLKNVTTIDATHKRYEWKSRYPIDYYLISIAVGNYNDYSYYMHFTGSSDSMLIQNYIYTNPAFLTDFKADMDTLGHMINFFSNLYGRYPFWQEKYGHAMAYSGGGMENQTMTTAIDPDVYLAAHELGHQWFGDNVTCSSWKDIVMNEGFASYSAFLYEEYYWGHPTAMSDMTSTQNYVKSLPGGAIYVNDTTSEDSIFDGRLVYSKGQCVLHTLRSVIDDDSAYFRIFRGYQAEQQYGTGSIETFKEVVRTQLGTVINGIDIDTFFNQWFYLQGYPVYRIYWNQIGTDVYVRVVQNTSVPASVATFKVPLDIRLRSGPTIDSVVRVVNDQPDVIYHFTWDRTMTGAALDPNNWLIYSILSSQHDGTVGIGTIDNESIAVAPNPATSAWNVSKLKEGSLLTLNDVSGRTVWSGTMAGTSTAIPAGNLAPGLYVLHAGNATESRSYKLVKE